MIAEGIIDPVLTVEIEIVVTTPVGEIEAGVGIGTTGVVVGAETETHPTAVNVAAAEKGIGQDIVIEVGVWKGDGKEMRNSQVGAG